MRRKLATLLMAAILVVTALPLTAAESWAAVTAPFTADCTIDSFIDDGITYTDWSGTSITLDVYTIKAPENADTITLDFGSDERVAYGYSDSAKQNYLSSCGTATGGAYADNGKVGETKAVIRKVDGTSFPAYVFVQTPYDDNWASTDLYVVKIEASSGDPATPGNANADQMYTATRELVQTKMVNKYGNEWYAMTIARDGQTVNDDYYASVIDTITEKKGSLETSFSNYTNNAKTALALTAGGIDVTNVAGYNLMDKIYDFDPVISQGVNGAIWALIAIRSNEEYYNESKENAYINFILDARNEDGLWDWGYGNDTDLTAQAVVALAPYYNSNDAVKSAVDVALEYFADEMKDDGAFESWGTENSNTTAAVILALCALDIQCQTDERFTSASGKNPVDGLALFFNEKTGFGYSDNKTYNQMATEQCYEALVALHRYTVGMIDIWDMRDVNLQEVLSRRIYGSSRYDTAIAVADDIMRMYDQKFENIIVANGDNYPDALTGSYTSFIFDAPILLVNSSTEGRIKDYIDKNLEDDGTVYILGGTGVVSSKFENSINKDGRTVKRLAGANRFDTNIEILEAGLKKDDVEDVTLCLCTADGYADSLSASASTMPIMIVGDKLTKAQKELLAKYDIERVAAIGGTSVVSDKVLNEVCSILSVEGEDKFRLAGKNRYETSVEVAKEFATEDKIVVLAYGQNFPDGLAGGLLATYYGAPLLLVDNNSYQTAAAYCKSKGVKDVITLGGYSLISNNVAKAMIKK